MTAAERIARALIRNCDAYCGRNGSHFRTFSARARRLWDMAARAGVADAVRAIVAPPMDARIAAELARQREERRSA